MTDSEKLRYKLKLDNEIKTIFGIDVTGQNLSLKDPGPLFEFLEIPNLTRSVGFGFEVSCGFRVSQNGPNNLVFLMGTGKEKEYRSVHVEKPCKDIFFQREYDECLTLLERRNSRSGNFKAIVNLLSALTPLDKDTNLSERELGLVSNFINEHFMFDLSSLKNTSKFTYVNREEGKNLKGHIPKSWTLKDFASWVLVVNRFPTGEEAMKFSRIKAEEMKFPRVKHDKVFEERI